MRQRQASITLEKLFESYDLKLQRTHKSDNYRKQFSWLKGYLDLVHQKKVLLENTWDFERGSGKIAGCGTPNFMSVCWH